MTTTAASGTLLPATHIEDATHLLLDLTVRQWRTATCEEVVEWVFTRLGYTVHLRLSTRADLDTYTWLLQDPSGRWLLYRLCTEDFALDLTQAIKPFHEAWADLSTDARLGLVRDRLADGYEAIRGATPNEMLLTLLGFDDLNQQGDLVGLIAWFVEREMVNLDAMRFLRALATEHADPDPTAVSATASRHQPLATFGPLPQP